MNIRPHAVLHMVAWCFASSIIITVLTGIMYSGISLTPVSQSDIWLMAGVIGFVFGIPFGYIAGTVLHVMTRKIEPPYTLEMMRAHTTPLIVLALLPQIPVFFMMLMFANEWLSLIPMMIPMLLAGIALAFAARRFLLRLTIWSANEENRKSKSKNKSKNSQKRVNRLSSAEIDASMIEPDSASQARRDKRDLP